MKLGVTLRKKPIIRIAPVKGAGLKLDFFESKVKEIEKWIANVRRLNPTLGLPELEKIISKWENPRNGDRFKILSVLFKSEQGLTRMRDLLHGSKADFVEGFPTEIGDIRNKIYVNLPYDRKGFVGPKH